MAEKTVVVSQQNLKPIKILKWKVREGFSVSIGSLVLLYDFDVVDKKQQRKMKSPRAGTVCKLIAQEGAIIQPGEALFELEACLHPTVMRDMCGECGADLSKDDLVTKASVPMIHSVPELKVSEEHAQQLGKADGERLLRDKKLVLLVDLDQTLIHTTNDIIPPNLKDVYHFQLYGPNSPWYHTRLRPGTHQFLLNISAYFELHICTFGARNYAHRITTILDADGRFFSNRVLSRDECFNPTSKTANLKALFPCGDHMVCIIDDREDVWSHALNLIHVKPYHFFQHTGDINAPPGLEKAENDEKEGIDLSKITNKAVEESAEDSAQNITPNSVNIEDTALRKDEENTIANINGDTVYNTDKSEIEENQNETNEEKTQEDHETNEKETNQMDADKINASETETETKQNRTKANSETKEVDSSETKEMDTSETKEMDSSETKEMDSSETKEMDSSETKEMDSSETKEMDSSETKEMNSSETKEMDSSETKEVDSSETKQVEGSETNKTNNETKEVEIKSALNSSLSLIEIEDPDDYLLYLEDILKRIHGAFYEEYDKMESGDVPDLKKIIPNVKGHVLKGCKMIFSGLVPTHIKLEHSRAYQVARSLGAMVTPNFEDGTTHLVAVRPGTAKVNAGRRRKNLKIVTPDWLWACAERWEHVNEKIFPLNSKGSKNRHPPPHCSSPEHAPNYAVHDTPGSRKRSPSGRFMDTINPLMSFSSDDIADMDKEVEDTLDTESESEDDVCMATNILEQSLKGQESSSSSGESLTAEMPRGHKRRLAERDAEDEGEEDTKDTDEFPSTKFRRGELLDSDLDIGQDSNSEGSVEAPDEIDDGEWNMMGAALEREFLSNS